MIYLQVCIGHQTFVLSNFGGNASKKSKTIVLDGECEKAIRNSKEICTSTPILAHANF